MKLKIDPSLGWLTEFKRELSDRRSPYFQSKNHQEKKLFLINVNNQNETMD